MPFTILRQDITKMNVDAVVNAANTKLLQGGGVCGAIFKAAGADKLTEACKKVSPIKTGGAAITPGFDLPAKYIIHAAGPVYNPLNKNQCAEQLRSAYIESLELALKSGCESIAFPLISSGIYGYPKDKALEVASRAVRDFLEKHDMDVYLAVFDVKSFVISKELMGNIESYIDEHYVAEHVFPRVSYKDSKKYLQEEQIFGSKAADVDSLEAPSVYVGSFEDFIGNLDEPFSDTLLRLIDSKGKTDVEVYKKANIDRKLFSKIRSVKGYTPKKATILALAVALELSLDETDNLLKRAGYALSHASKFDLIIEYFIVTGKYDIYEINEVLFKYDQPLLGA